MKFARLSKILVWALAVGIALSFFAALALTWLKHRSEIDTVSDQQKLARTLGIIRNSSAAHPGVLKVLFYGQSITRSGWDAAVIAHWHEKYPNTTFVVRNMALGGFDADALERTTERDLAEFYPDLIIFHVYGDHHAYERIIRLMRSRTSADIVAQTDHGEIMPDPPCAEGLHFTLHRQPGCAGFGWVYQRQWGDRMSYHLIPAFGKKYGLAVEPQRTWWRDYLLRTHTPPQALLANEVHPNEQGKALIAAFFNQYFDSLVTNWNGESEAGVTSIPPAPGQSKVQFVGSRLELISTRPLPSLNDGIIQPSIDGILQQQLDGCYLAARVSPLPSVPDWPALRRVSFHSDDVAEDWEVTVTNFSPDQKSFRFSIHGAFNEPQGEGDSAHTFVSNSGQLKIEPQDWMFARAFRLTHIPVSDPFILGWRYGSICGWPEVIDVGPSGHEYRYILGASLSNGPHTASITLPPAEAAAIREFRAYQPPLKLN